MKIDMTIDIHEASLGYPVVSTYVCHQRADEMCMMASMVLSAEQFAMKTETSPKSLRGLTHREVGDFTNSFAVLMETPEPFIEKFAGPMTEDLMLNGRDEFVQTAATRGLLYTDYDIKFPSLGGDAIVYENGGYIYRYDIAADKATKVPVSIAEDMVETLRGIGGLRIADASIMPVVPWVRPSQGSVT